MRGPSKPNLTVPKERQQCLTALTSKRFCASCKKIRDDKSHWGQVKVCIRKHTEATFTQGTCPDSHLDDLLGDDT